tara:strand:- start:11061 stop:11609 length:549 start_codon:yes stop_codon:yes gene_type:complete
MGFVLNVDLETSEGPSQEVYVRIESLTYNKATSEVRFQITYWQNRDKAIRFNRTYLQEEKNNAVGLIQEGVIYFKDEKSDGVQITFNQYMKVYTVVEEEVEIPIYENKQITKEVPYVSFDDNGDELILYRTVNLEEQVQIGTSKKVEQVISGGILDNIFGFCYDKIYEELLRYFPKDKIQIV